MLRPFSRARSSHSRTGQLTKKQTSYIYGGCVALVGAWGANRWPDHAAAFQIGMYSFLAVGALTKGVWEERQRPRFWMAMGAMLVLHLGTMFLIRGLFPFRTVFTIVPFLMVEMIAIYIAMLKILGY